MLPSNVITSCVAVGWNDAASSLSMPIEARLGLMIFTLRFASTASASLATVSSSGIAYSVLSPRAKMAASSHVTSTNLRVSPSEKPTVEEESL